MVSAKSKSAAAAAAAEEQTPVVDAPVPTEIDVVEDSDDAVDDSEYSDDDDDDDEELEFDPISQLAQLLVTEEGQPVADILVGIKDALDKHNKILFKISTLLEAKFA